jgi:hypothetical protein
VERNGLALTDKVSHVYAVGWLLIIGLWSLCYGLRGIVWHQIVDAQADRLSNTGTFVARHGEKRAARLIKWAVFPMELLTNGIGIALSGMVTILAAIVEPKPPQRHYPAGIL